MTSIRMHCLAWALAALAGTAWAQAGPGPGMGAQGAGPGASAPGMGMGPGGGRMGPGGGRHHGAQWGRNHTRGWAMMNDAERNQHRNRMQAMKTQGECQAYHAQHHEQMVARAKEKGVSPPTMPRRDPCARLPK